MLDDFDIVDLFLEDDEEEYLDESATKEGLPRYIELLFEHLLKFEYQPERRSRGWLKTINTNNTNIMTVLGPRRGTIYTEVNSKYLDDRFVVAAHDAGRAIGQNLSYLSRPIDWDREFIMNKEAIKAWLYDHNNYADNCKAVGEYINDTIKYKE